jgi:hypothetical protein
MGWNENMIKRVEWIQNDTGVGCKKISETPSVFFEVKIIEM